MAFTPKAGKQSTITLNSTGVQLKRCSVRIRSTMIDVSAFGTTADSDSNYWGKTLAGLCRSTMTASGSYDSGEPPIGTGVGNPGIRAGLAGTTPTFLLYSGASFVVPGNVEETEVNSEVDQDIQFSFTLQGDGAVAYPS